MNVAPRYYTWPEFYDNLVDLSRYSFSGRAILKRIPATATMIPKWMNVVRSVSTEGWGRIRYHTMIRGLLDTDRSMRDFFEGQTETLPEFYVARVKQELGPLYRYLPPGALMHDPNAYLHSSAAPVQPAGAVQLTAASARSAD